MSQSQNLRNHALQLGINEERYRWIVDHVESAISSFFSNGGNLDVSSSECKIDIFALTLMNSCDRGDEGRFFCQAVKSILQEKHGVGEEPASNIVNFIGQRCAQIAAVRSATERKPSSSGCGGVAVVGMLGLAALGYYVRQIFFA